MKHFGSTSGLTALVEDQATPANGMAAYITSSYNSGYQNGDIKGAFLSDTDDTDLVGSGELVTNGTFDTDSDWTLTQPTSGSTTISGGSLNIDTQNGSYAAATQTVSVQSGKGYYITFDATISAGTIEVGIGGDSTFFANGVNSSGSYEAFWVADRSSFTLEIKRQFSAGATTASIDNISVKLADADRSVNNKGLIVNGTITRTYVDEV